MSTDYTVREWRIALCEAMPNLRWRIMTGGLPTDARTIRARRGSHGFWVDIQPAKHGGVVSAFLDEVPITSAVGCDPMEFAIRVRRAIRDRAAKLREEAALLETCTDFSPRVVK